METDIKVKKLDYRDLQADLHEAVKGCVPVKLCHLFDDTAVPFDVSFPLLETPKSLKLKVLVQEGETVNSQLHAMLARKGVQEVYLPREKEDEFLKYLSFHVERLCHSTEISCKHKTQLLYDNAEAIVRKLFKEKPSRSIIGMGQQLVSTIAFHLASDNIAVDALLSIFCKDYHIFTHCVQVALLSMAFARHLDWSQEEVTDLGLGTLFHDIGKSSIDEAILNKSASLTKDEFEIIKRHTLYGYQRLKETQVMTRSQLEIVLRHHEAMDGSGYPNRLQSHGIHKYARLARIIDVYDALTTRRAYKDALPQLDALNLMYRTMHQTFDENLLNAFVQFLGMEESVQQVTRSARLNAELGSQMLVQFRSGEGRLKAVLVGMELNEYLILRLPNATTVSQKQLHPGAHLVVRYVHMGTVYGFHCAILDDISRPFRLLFLSYPESIEMVSLRQHPRIDCFLPGEIKIKGTTYPAVIVDISFGGCKVAVSSDRDTGRPAVEADDMVSISTQLLVGRTSELFVGKVRLVTVEDRKLTLGVRFMMLSDQASSNLHRFIENVLTIVRD